MRAALFGAAFALVFGCAAAHSQQAGQPSLLPPRGTATFAGGNFWYLEADFDTLSGVLQTAAGFAGGTVANPTSGQVASGRTGHAQAVQIIYDPARIGYRQLLDFFWRHHDPLTPGAQICDKGSQYRAVIFTHDEEQARLAAESKAALEASRRFDRPIVTEIVPFTEFFRAEDDHQDYYLRHPVKYRWQRFRCGRDGHLERLWGSKPRG
jgi:methionine-S-sulfoxide reductase